MNLTKAPVLLGEARPRLGSRNRVGFSPHLSLWLGGLAGPETEGLGCPLVLLGHDRWRTQEPCRPVGKGDRTGGGQRLEFMFWGQSGMRSIFSLLLRGHMTRNKCPTLLASLRNLGYKIEQHHCPLGRCDQSQGSRSTTVRSFWWTSVAPRDYRKVGALCLFPQNLTTRRKVIMKAYMRWHSAMYNTISRQVQTIAVPVSLVKTLLSVLGQSTKHRARNFSPRHIRPGPERPKTRKEGEPKAR